MPRKTKPSKKVRAYKKISDEFTSEKPEEDSWKEQNMKFRSAFKGRTTSKGLLEFSNVLDISEFTEPPQQEPKGKLSGSFMVK